MSAALAAAMAAAQAAAAQAGRALAVAVESAPAPARRAVPTVKVPDGVPELAAAAGSAFLLCLDCRSAPQMARAQFE